MKNNTTKPASSIFQDGKVKPGVYKIQNIVSKTYVEVKDHLRELCGRPPSALEHGEGQWEIRPLGSGYTIRKAGSSTSARPDQFCIMLDGISNGYSVSVSDFPVAWKIQVVDDAIYSGSEYVRISWGSTNMVWDLAQWGADRDGTRIQLMANTKSEPCRIWELVPVKIENVASQPSSSSVPQRDSSPIPSYEENAGTHCCTCSHRTTEPSDDGFGTTVIEVTTVTTRNKYRLED